jgi:hypothetical protein
MGLTLVNVKWTLVRGDTNGRTFRGQGTAFDTDTKTIVPYDQTKGYATLDPNPVDVHLVDNDLLYSECAADYTRTTWLLTSSGGVTTTTEPNSPFCGYTAPLTCDLGTASVNQLATDKGFTLTFTFTGTLHGQAYYSLDGGAEQTSPVFYGVAPNKAHALVLRDGGLANCTRSVDVQLPALATAPQLPPAPTGPAQGLDFVAQPLWYARSGQPARALVELELWAESAHGADDFALVLTMRKRVDTGGNVTFRLDTLLYGLLSAFVPPALPSATLLCTTNLVNYYVRTTTTLAGQSPVFAVSPLRTALRGGLPAEWQATDYFTWRVSAFPAPTFLSWQPTGAGTYAAGAAKPVVTSQPEWLFFPCELGLTNAQLRIRRGYSLTEAGPETEDFEHLDRPSARGWAQRLLAIPLLPSRSGFNYMSVRVETQAGVVVSQQAHYRFVLPNPRTRYLLFSNSLGGLDTLRCEGRLEGSLEVATDKVERPARPGELAPAADRQLSDLVASRKLKLATGWLNGADMSWLQELVLARELWQHVAGQLRPLDWPKRSLNLASDEPSLRGLLLEFDYAYAPTAYAPDRNA